MSSYSSANRRNYTAGQRHGRAAAPKQEWVPRGSITLSPPADTGSVPSIVQDIQDKLARGAVECLSCYDMVRRSTPIWSCSTCFSIFHLNCIRKWARSPACIAADDWHCPGCQIPQSTPARDLSYTCFCGRRRDPPNDQHLSPHSCGKPCGKPLDGGGKELRCPHVCVLQCHPGPCPPCKAFAPRRKCPCGKTNVVRKCSDRRAALSCEKPCNRFLGCGRHTCERVCHNGACGSCQELLTTKCFCGKKEQEVVCSDVAMKGNFDEKSGLFSCDDVCGRSLLCGNHVCRENCHPGLCGECELLPGKISTCHCGKKKIVDERMTCMDLIPTCSNVCGKPLVCKTHFCRMRCHEGDCLPCSALVQQRCRCGSSRRTVECYQLFDARFKFICERTCYRKKNCGRHRCKERCCVLSKTGDCDPHLCSLPCGKMLRCGKHTCQLPCHGDRCSPCLETNFTDLTCASGMTAISPPIPCGTPMPSCPHLCSVPQSCGLQASHSCHFGDCPQCIGGHVMLANITCCSNDIRCNQQCGKTGQCGIHAYARTSHPTRDSSIASLSESGIRSSCGQICGSLRRGRKHTCTALCHPLSSCAEQSSAAILCSCDGIIATVPCGARASSSSFSNYILLESSVIPELSVSLRPVDCDGNTLGQWKLSCDEECDRAARQWQVTDVFDVTLRNLDAFHVRENLATSDVFSDLMWRQPKRVIAIEDIFKLIVLRMPKEGSGSSMKVYAFGHILMEKRAAVLQIAEWWKLPVQTAGWEPKSLPTVHATCKSKPGGGLKPGFLMVAAYPPAYDPLIDMDPRCVVALLFLPRDADISSLVLKFGRENDLVCLNDKNPLAVFSDPARVTTALQRLSHGFTFQGAVIVAENVGVAAPAAAWSNECEVAVRASNSSKWTVALELDFNEPDWTEASILVWRGNHGNLVPENAN
ncbi:hypothetical protein IEQ34_004766 [Dendrobium chrysotoxum]|uniref:RING-type domain-containing protein n=1 Tax=Dendrobium chrysotoxum TaxID=161865 RepID=A0AAV7HJ14_DENCH|nr:hypothetical protein IEQ34_004766 [Dendrobium chrysotoxum]